MNQLLEGSVKLFLNIFFEDEIVKLDIVKEYFIRENRYLIIKLNKLGEKMLVVGKKVTPDKMFVNKEILKLFISSDPEIEMYMKDVPSTRVYSENDLLLVLHFRDYLIISRVSVIEQIMKPLFDFLGRTFSIRSYDSDEVFNKLFSVVTELFYGFSGIPWDLDNFFCMLDKVSLQFIFSRLITMLSEDEIYTLVSSLKESGYKIKSNISKRTWESVENLVKYKESTLIYDSDWIETTKFFTSIHLNKILQQDGVDLPISKKLDKIREALLRAFFGPRVLPGVISKIVRYIDKIQKIDEIPNYTSTNTIAKALVGVDMDVLNIFSIYISRSGYSRLEEDIKYFQKRYQGNELELIKDKINFLENALKIIFNSRVKKFEKLFHSLLPKLDSPKLYYAVNTTNPAAYLLALLGIRKELGNDMLDSFLSKTSGSLLKTGRLFLDRRIGFTFAYGDTLIKEKTREFFEKLYFIVKVESTDVEDDW
ncbi:MAG: hypothetical protein N2712_02550 [Brevinematales bacterium]|nr:hypothetical protein [Brevinematales bacterium]